MTRILLATLAYVVVSFSLAAPWHLIWFKKFYDGLGIYNRAEPIFPLGILSMLIQGVVMAVVYPRFYRGGVPLMEGLKFGLLMGVFLFSVSTMANAAKMQVTSLSDFFLIQLIFHTLQFGLAGAAVGLIFGRLQS